MSAKKQRIPPWLKRAIWAAVGVAALVFAIQGGEYGTRDLVHQRRQRNALHAEIDSLAHLVDSLTKYRDRVVNDPALQERIGREEFGWVRGNKELLYRFAKPDSVAHDK